MRPVRCELIKLTKNLKKIFVFTKRLFIRCRDERCEFIRAKYVEKKFTVRSCTDERDLLSDLEHAVNNKNLYNLLQVFAEDVDLSASLPSSVSLLPNSRLLALSARSNKSEFKQDCGETALHLAIKREMGTSLHLVDFLIQNMSSVSLDKRTNNV